MTLTPAEVARFARTSQLLPMPVTFVDATLCAYWRLVFNRPELDMEDTEAIVCEWTRSRSLHAVTTYNDIERSETPFWRSTHSGGA